MGRLLLPLLELAFQAYAWRSIWYDFMGTGISSSLKNRWGSEGPGETTNTLAAAAMVSV